jgi:hypothetical protein
MRGPVELAKHPAEKEREHDRGKRAGRPEAVGYQACRTVALFEIRVSMPRGERDDDENTTDC